MPKGSKLRLDGTSCPAWRAQADVLLDLQDLEDIVGEPADQKEPRWEQRNRRACAFLYTACSDKVQVTYLVGIQTGLDVLRASERQAARRMTEHASIEQAHYASTGHGMKRSDTVHG